MKIELDFETMTGIIPTTDVPEFAVSANIVFELTPENTLEAYDYVSEKLFKDAANTNTQSEQEA